MKHVVVVFYVEVGRLCHLQSLYYFKRFETERKYFGFSISQRKKNLCLRGIAVPSQLLVHNDMGSKNSSNIEKIQAMACGGERQPEDKKTIGISLVNLSL